MSRAKVLCAPASLMTSGAQLAPVRHTHSGGLIPVQNHLRHVGADDNVTAMVLNQRRDRIRDSRCASDGITGAAEIVRRDDRMHAEAALRGRESVIAPLPGEHANQFAIVRDARENVRSGAACPAEKSPAHQAASQPRRGTRNRFLREVRAGGLRGSEHGRDVAVDRRGIARKVLLHVVAEVVEARDEIVATIGEHHAVIHIRHARPGELPIGHVIKHAPHLRGRVVHLADIVHADVPLIAGAVKRVRVPSRRVVAFENENFLAGFRGKKRGSGEAADAGADDDRVPSIFESVLLVGMEIHFDAVSIRLALD